MSRTQIPVRVDKDTLRELQSLQGAMHAHPAFQNRSMSDIVREAIHHGLPVMVSTYSGLIGYESKGKETKETKGNRTVRAQKSAGGASAAAETIPCLLCGQECKSIKGHLSKSHKDTTVEDYQQQFGADTPLVSPGYSARRSKASQGKRRGSRKPKVDSRLESIGKGVDASKDAASQESGESKKQG